MYPYKKEHDKKTKHSKMRPNMNKWGEKKVWFKNFLLIKKNFFRL